MSKMQKKYDVAIVGAGPGGSTAAYYLAKRGLNILLLDKASFPRDKTCGDGLTPRALKVMQDMGVLETAERSGFQISGMRIVSPNGSYTEIEIPQDADLPNHALVLPRYILDDLLRKQAQKAGAVFESPVRVNHIERSNKIMRVYGRQGNQTFTFQAGIVIIATGASINLLKQIGLLTKMPQTVITARTYMESLPDIGKNMHFRFDGVPLPGYGWLFPISNTMVNVGLGIFPKRMDSRKLSSIRLEFQKFLNKLDRNQATKSPALNSIKSYPIRIDFPTSPTVGDGVLLVGEAAGLVNPLTGEGIDYALESGKIAAEFLSGSFAAGDFNTESLLNYDALLKKQFHPLFTFSKRIQRFCMPYPICLDSLTKIAEMRTDLKILLTKILLGYQSIPKIMTPLQTIKDVLKISSPTSH